MHSSPRRLALVLMLIAAGQGCRHPGGTAESQIAQAGEPTPSRDVQTLTHSYGGVTAPYRLRAPASAKGGGGGGRPLLVFFHGNLGANFGPAAIAPTRILASVPGDDADEPQKTYTIDGLAADAGAGEYFQEFVLLSILVPTDSERDYRGYKVITWGSLESPLSKIPAAQIDLNAAYAESLIDQVAAEQNVDPQRVYLVGQSGGALFLTHTLIPRLATKYAGGGILLCGGEPARPEYRGNLTPEFARRFPLHFHTTTKESEHIQPLIAKAMADYSALWQESGRPPTLTVDGDGKHCKFTASQPAIIQGVMQQWAAP